MAKCSASYEYTSISRTTNQTEWLSVLSSYEYTSISRTTNQTEWQSVLQVTNTRVSRGRLTKQNGKVFYKVFTNTIHVPSCNFTVPILSFTLPFCCFKSKHSSYSTKQINNGICSVWNSATRNLRSRTDDVPLTYHRVRSQA